MGLGLVVAAIVAALDQLSKYLMLHYLWDSGNFVEVLPFFNLVNAWNTGVSFSMFSNQGNLGTVLLCLVAATIVGFLLWWLKGEKIRAYQVALGMIIGGAMGNMIDRLRVGAVFDFLDFHLGAHHWPAFNLADSCIFIGAFIIITHNLWFSGPKKKKEKKTNENNA